MSIDLNLLVVLDALLDEAHVSRAAQRLNRSQPAVSNALQRCRDLFGDELLERKHGAMRLTPRAEAMRGPLKSLLGNVHDLVDPPKISLSDLRQTIRITTADDPSFMIAGPLIAALHRTAPGVTVIFEPWNGEDAAAKDLLNGDTDITISILPRDIEGLERITLLQETYIVAMRKGHPAAERFDLDTWLDWPHIVMSGRGEAGSPLDAQLRSLGRARRIGVVVPSFQLTLSLLVQTDHIAMVPRHGFMLHGHPGLVGFDPPISIDGFPVNLAWHTRRSGDAGIRHVVATIKEVFTPQGS
ncbi:LysR family transcriptional regulator [Hoeflea prorocentri]